MRKFLQSKKVLIFWMLLQIGVLVVLFLWSWHLYFWARRMDRLEIAMRTRSDLAGSFMAFATNAIEKDSPEKDVLWDFNIAVNSVNRYKFISTGLYNIAAYMKTETVINKKTYRKSGSLRLVWVYYPLKPLGIYFEMKDGSIKEYPKLIRFSAEMQKAMSRTAYRLVSVPIIWDDVPNGLPKPGDLDYVFNNVFNSFIPNGPWVIHMNKSDLHENMRVGFILENGVREPSMKIRFLTSDDSPKKPETESEEPSKD